MSKSYIIHPFTRFFKKKQKYCLFNPLTIDINQSKISFISEKNIYKFTTKYVLKL